MKRIHPLLIVLLLVFFVPIMVLSALRKKLFGSISEGKPSNTPAPIPSQLPADAGAPATACSDEHLSPIARLLADEAATRSAGRPKCLHNGRLVVLSVGRDHERWMQTEVSGDKPVVLVVGNSDNALLGTIVTALNESGLFTAGWTPDLYLAPKNFDIYGVQAKFLVTNNRDAFDIVIVDPQVHPGCEFCRSPADTFADFGPQAFRVGLLHSFEDEEMMEKEGAQYFIGTGDLIVGSTKQQVARKLKEAYLVHRGPGECGAGE